MLSVLSDPLLAASPNGYVRACACCERLIVRVGETVLAMGQDELTRLGLSLGAACPVQAGWGWSVRLRTPDGTVCLGEDEARALYALITRAQDVLRLDAFLLGTLGPRPAA